MDKGREIGKRASVSCLLCRIEHRYPVRDIAGANMANSTNPTTTNIDGLTANRLLATCPLTLFDSILNKTILLPHMSCPRCGVFIAVICSVCPNQKVANGSMSKFFGGWRNTLFFFSPRNAFCTFLTAPRTKSPSSGNFFFFFKKKTIAKMFY